MATGSYERKQFTGGATPTTLAAPLSNIGTSITVEDASSFPDGTVADFVIVINRGTATEEKILCASRVGNVIQIQTRGYDDNVAQNHTIGEVVEHVLDASTIDQANRYVNLQTTKGALVSHDGANANAVTAGTDGQVLVADSTQTNGLVWSSRLTTAETNLTTAQNNITALQGTDIDITLTGDVTGTGTITNLSNVSFATTVVDDSHNHIIANVDDLQTTLDGKLSTNAGSVDTSNLADNSVTDAKLRDSAALSVIGNITNVSANPGDITAGTDGHVLRRSGTSLGFGTIATDGITDAAVTNAKLRDSSANSVIGRSAATAGDVADIAAGTDGHVLRLSGTTLGFGTVATAGIADDAVTDAKLRNSSGTSVIGRASSTSGGPADISASTDGYVLRRSSGVLGFGLITSSNIASSTITGSNIASATITATQLASNSVDSAEIVSGAVDEVHLSDSLVSTSTLALVNNWVGTLYYFKFGNIVVVNVVFTGNGGLNATSSHFATMPVGYRPNNFYHVAATGSYGAVTAYTSGELYTTVASYSGGALLVYQGY